MTEKQRKAAEFKSYMDEQTIELQCAESLEFIKTPENNEMFNKLLDLTEQKRKLEEEVQTLRQQILSKMNDSKCSKVISITRKKQLTISHPGTRYSEKKFNEEKFKRDYPELYESYRESQGKHWSNGGTLTLTTIRDKTLKKYMKHSKYFRHEMPESRFGDVYFISEFKDLVESGCITSYDGYGEYYNPETKTFDKSIRLQEIIDETYPKNCEFVAWYNV